MPVIANDMFFGWPTVALLSFQRRLMPDMIDTREGHAIKKDIGCNYRPDHRSGDHCRKATREEEV
jgi:hypothetical protein